MLVEMANNPSINFKNSADRWRRTAGPWADEIIEEINFNFINDFKECEERLVDALIDPKKITGASHTNYHGISWREFLTTGIRISPNIEGLDTNPNYYDNPRSVHFHDGWTIYDVDGDLFIAEGHHRSIIAKFRAHEDGVKQQQVYDLVRIKLNREAICKIDLLDRLMRRNQKYEIKAKETDRNSTGQVIHYTTLVTLYNVKGYHRMVLDPTAAISIVRHVNRRRYAIESGLRFLKSIFRTRNP